MDDRNSCSPAQLVDVLAQGPKGIERLLVVAEAARQVLDTVIATGQIQRLDMDVIHLARALSNWEERR